MRDRARSRADENATDISGTIGRRELLLSGSSLAAATALVAAGLSDPARAQQGSAAGSKPNIVLILAADLGTADLGYRGSDIRTPQIDSLAREGVSLESYYGLPLSTPARAALLTGRYPMRHGLQTQVIFPSHTYGLPTDEYTLPQALKDAGYRTAMVGKWHLGHADEKFWPQHRGFDHFYGSLVGEVDHFTKDRGGLIDWQRNGKFFKEDGYATTQLGDEAVKLIAAHDESAPLFLYVASPAPQAPFQAPQPSIDAYGSIPNETRRTYAAMITELDNQVGRIVAALEKKGMRQNTLIFFSTDNGGATNPRFVSAQSGDERKESASAVPDETFPASNGRFRGGKGSLYEGGVRLPAIVNWPGRLDPRIVNEPLHHVDWMPTLLVLAGSGGRADRLFDGRDIWTSLADGAPSPHQDILINVEPARGAIRSGNWKLVKFATLPGRTELFDVVKDPGEQSNVASQNQAVVRRLEARLMDYARQQKPAEWIRAQPQLVGTQGKTVFDPDFVLDDSGLPYERAAIPGALTEGRAVAPAGER